jgi:hypothetical protein
MIYVIIYNSFGFHYLCKPSGNSCIQSHVVVLWICAFLLTETVKQNVVHDTNDSQYASDSEKPWSQSKHRLKLNSSLMSAFKF